MPALDEPSETAPEIAAQTAGATEPPPVPVERRRAAELQAVAQDRWSLRATVDRAFKDDLETLRCLLAHKVPDGDLAEVLHEAIRCAVERHGKRRGAVAPERQANRPAQSAKTTRAPSAAVRREVWARDAGRCTFVARDGRRCESRFRLEFDHVDEEGPPTAANLRLRCRPHNLLHAEETYGRAFMDLFRRDPARSTERTSAATP